MSELQLLYFSPLPAASYWQRPRFFVEAARDFGVKKVLWVEPYPRRLPRWSDLKRMRLRERVPHHEEAWPCCEFPLCPSSRCPAERP